ncbi:hypothetical protein [Fictibacillus phosphorivorans]|uniref:hypothetical protein n=1 Tax=Fictibacillus phosphorivorans TaxID=1221500 RepID=UPI00203D96E6|nr:hypothetical protein [Fictibacillus phosphorivorans]MCM3717796.1 hypothetical protein [Fictibacillus phosphorivorans]MCM3777024.1 hypothetical protein [Fictibacillus phosphorivorans]
MSGYPNMREFYQKGLILIGENDRAALLQKAGENASVEESTHWLIAMEGSEKQPDVYHWKVLIYPSDSKKVNCYTSPYFSSQHFASIHDAINYSNELSQKAREDQLNTLE